MQLHKLFLFVHFCISPKMKPITIHPENTSLWLYHVTLLGTVRRATRQGSIMTCIYVGMFITSAKIR